MLSSMACRRCKCSRAALRDLPDTDCRSMARGSPFDELGIGAAVRRHMHATIWALSAQASNDLAQLLPDVRLATFNYWHLCGELAAWPAGRVRRLRCWPSRKTSTSCEVVAQAANASSHDRAGEPMVQPRGLQPRTTEPVTTNERRENEFRGAPPSSHWSQSRRSSTRTRRAGSAPSNRPRSGAESSAVHSTSAPPYTGQHEQRTIKS